MKKILLLLLVLNLGFSQTKRILFLGNSYTGVNDLPGMFSQMVTSTGSTCATDSNTPGGYTFNLHTTNTTSQAKIQQGNWDYVVLQEQSQIPSFPDDYVNQNCFPYATQLNDLILQYNPCAETVFYMTWGRQNGDSQFCATNPPVCTYEGMDNLLYARYMTMGQTNNAIVSPVGAVWRYIRTNYPEINLYSGDGSHPSLEGTFTAALTFYSSIYRANPNNVTFTSSLTASTITKIKTAVTNVVYNQLSQWYIGNYDVTADFSYQQIASNQIQFTNLSTNATSYLWEFGDGNTSTESNPLHTYLTLPTSPAKLTASFCNTSSEKSNTIVFLSNADFETTEDAIYYNSNNLEIETSKHINSFELYAVTGQLLIKETNTKTIAISQLNSGVYFIRLNLEGKEIIKKIFKN